MFPIKIATGFRKGMFSHTILTVTIRGTERIIPTGPQIQPHTVKLTRIINGERSRFSPRILGSRIFPIKKLTEIIVTEITATCQIEG